MKNLENYIDSIKDTISEEVKELLTEILIGNSEYSYLWNITYSTETISEVDEILSQLKEYKNEKQTGKN